MKRKLFNVWKHDKKPQMYVYRAMRYNTCVRAFIGPLVTILSCTLYTNECDDKDQGCRNKSNCNHICTCMTAKLPSHDSDALHKTELGHPKPRVTTNRWPPSVTHPTGLLGAKTITVYVNASVHNFSCPVERAICTLYNYRWQRFSISERKTFVFIM